MRLWSVVSVNELKLTAQNTRVGNDLAATGVVLEDEMTLDAPAASAAFDDSLDMVRRCLQLDLFYDSTSFGNLGYLV